MYFQRYKNTDYAPDCKKLPAEELKTFGIERTNSRYLKCFNPGVTSNNEKVTCAFFGWNAYAEDYDFANKNFNWKCYLEGIQEKYDSPYHSHLSNVLDLYRVRLGECGLRQESLYFSNVIKLVLNKNEFLESPSGRKSLCISTKTSELFSRLLESEIRDLYQQGCRIFVSFGNDADCFVSTAFTNAIDDKRKEIEFDGNYGLFSSAKNAIYVKNRHFSRYWVSQSEAICAEISKHLTPS